MATGNVLVTVVDVGQGQCTFVEIYDDSSPTPKLINTLLFDCGSDKENSNTITNLDYIAAKALTKSTPGFDRIFFSHSDNDHISLTWYILNKMSKTKKPVIDAIWYGGSWSKFTKRGFNILDYINNYKLCATSNIQGFNSNSTDYGKVSKKYDHTLWSIGDKAVNVYGIAANVLSDDPDWDDNDVVIWGKNAEELNRVSLIAGLYSGTASFVICGDATNKTMAAVDGLFSEGTTVFDNNIMTTLPHHGSRATGFAVPAAKDASKEAVKVVDTFAAIMKSKTITVSAYAKHRHPSLQIINRFIPTQTTPVVKDARLTETNAHRVTANIDMDLGVPKGTIIFRQVDYTFETQINTFSTYYFDGSTTFAYKLGTVSVTASQGSTGTINGFACWQYTTKSNAAVLAGYENLTLPLTAFTAAPSLMLAGELTGEPPVAQVAPMAEVVAEPEPVRLKLKRPFIRPGAIPVPHFQTRVKQFR